MSQLNAECGTRNSERISTRKKNTPLPGSELPLLRSREDYLERTIDAVKLELAPLTQKLIRLTNDLSNCKKAIAELTLVKMNRES